MAPVHMAWADILSVICTIPNAFRRRETHPFFLVPVLAFLLAMFVWLLPWQPEMFGWFVVCRHQKKMVATWFRLRLCLQVALFCGLAHRRLFAHLCVFKKRLTSGERMCLNRCLLFQDGCFSANCLSNMLCQFSYLSLVNSSTFLWCVCYHWEPRSSWRLAQHGGIICLVPASRSWCTGRILLLGQSTGLDQDIRSRCFLPILRGVQQIP